MCEICLQVSLEYVCYECARRIVIKSKQSELRFSNVVRQKQADGFTQRTETN